MAKFLGSQSLGKMGAAKALKEKEEKRALPEVWYVGLTEDGGVGQARLQAASKDSKCERIGCAF